MTRFIHDQFAKDYLEQLLSPYGDVQAPRRVSGEVRQIDVWFAPNSQELTTISETLGLLGRLAVTPSIIEPYRNRATVDEICDCLLKLLEIRGELQREANRNKTNIQDSELPRLWIITPTASEAILSGFGAIINDSWLPGVYLMPEHLRTGIVVIHQLPRTPETLWLRILGRDNVQKQAIDEIVALPADSPLRSNAIKLLNNLRKNLQITPIPDDEDRGLVMRLAPLYEQDREQAVQEGIQLGKRTVVENFLRIRFGQLDEELSAVIVKILALPPEEFTPSVFQLSREELLARFGEQK